MITVITVLSMISMLPSQKTMLPEIAFRYVPYGEIGETAIADPRDAYDFDEFAAIQEESVPVIIDDIVLSQFMKTYIEDLKGLNMTWSIPTEDREMVRSMLEGMGQYNAVKLKRLLDGERNDKKMERIIRLLKENLFEEDMDRLNDLLIK
ncbi:MAG: hypothetical protein ACOYVK_17450 [Bacillota bacterium]